LEVGSFKTRQFISEGILRQPGTNPRACRATDSANQEPGFLPGALGQEFFFFLLRRNSKVGVTQGEAGKCSG
jgi:hypothetical protein